MKSWVGLVVLIAGCKGSTPETPAPQASASTSPSASAAPSASVATIADEAGTEDAAVDDPAVATGNNKAFPPLAKDAAWSVVRWNMTSAEVIAAFKDAGVLASPANDRKTGAERVSVKSNGWDATIYFAAGKPNQIVVIGSNLGKDQAAKAVAKISERGPATTTTERTEQRWKKSGTVTVVVSGDGSMREEYVRDGTPAGGNVGLAKLTWGMAPAAVQSALQAAGYTARITKGGGGVDPCSMPNAPPDCGKKAATPSIAITKGDQEGTASFDDKGLTQVVLSGTSADKGAARTKELEAQLGKPASSETSTKTFRVDTARATGIDLEVKEHEGGSTVLATYRPKS